MSVPSPVAQACKAVPLPNPRRGCSMRRRRCSQPTARVAAFAALAESECVASAVRRRTSDARL
eukprot:349954-Chlamydomonas_euryale.AAC.5